MIFPTFRNRRSRETSILKAIENGAETLFDIVSDVYSDVDRSAWIAAASNVRLHVDYLAQQDKLPEVTYSMAIYINILACTDVFQLVSFVRLHFKWVTFICFLSFILFGFMQKNKYNYYNMVHVPT